MEAALAGLVLISVGWVAWRFWRTGYLPQPFYFEKTGTLMDWYTTVYWANRPGAYSVWHAIYPPLSFVFLKLFSLHACYAKAAVIARDCDWLGRLTLGGLGLLNAGLAWRCYRRIEPGAAVARAAALSLGLPMLYAFERGNLIIPTFTAFVLAQTPGVTGSWRAWFAQAVAINFKPYLAVVLLARAVRRQWGWLLACCLACLLIYLVSYAIEGEGSPSVLAANIVLFCKQTAGNFWNDVYNSTSYLALIGRLIFGPPTLVPAPPGLQAILGWALAVVLALALVGAILAHLAAWRRPDCAPPHRLMALSLGAVLICTGASGYSEIFLVFLVFFEPWRSPGQAVALVGAYLLSISADYVVAPLSLGAMHSWLGGREVIPVAGYAVGQFLRPGLVLVIEYSLAAATLVDLIKVSRESARVAPSRPAISMARDEHGVHTA